MGTEAAGGVPDLGGTLAAVSNSSPTIGRPMSILAASWLPIVLSAVLVFVLSAIIHMALKYHNSDYQAAAERRRGPGRDPQR